ncbi:MAG: type II secretion system secretin GspD [Rubrivivax sp.]|nr:type II secretion system secretin GspD [Rubrivivax sp.]
MTCARTSPRRTAGRSLALLMALALALPVQGQPTASRRSAAPVTVNFVNADIEAVSRAFAAMINRQIAVDPRVKGTMTVYSEQPQSVAEAYQGFLSALRGLGFAVVDSGGLLKVVPEADAKLQTSTVSVGEVARKGDQVITQIFTLRYENPNNLVAVLRPLISANNTINASPGNNSLVITDYAENLQRIAKIIAALDQPAASDIEVIALEHVVAGDIAAIVQRLADGTPTVAVPGMAAGGATTVLADARSNSLIVRTGNAAKLAAVRAVVAKLDRPVLGEGVPGAPGMWVVHLKNADATRLATVLRAAFAATGSGSAGGSSGGGGGAPINALQALSSQPGMAAAGATLGGTASAQSTAPLSTSAQPSTGGFIQADPATNSLIITAALPMYRQLRAMIEQLDSRRAQVYIESMIVEVAGGDATDFGFDWLGTLGSQKVLAAQNLIADSNRPGIVSVNTGLVTGAIAVGSGLNVGLARTINGITSLTTLLRLLQSQSKTNIVSTPNLITLDNEEAKIVIGKNVPFVTGQFTNTGTATTSPFQTIERKDVGITLRIKPQIGENGAIRMQIYQEQSAVTAPEAGTANAGPSTTKRSIEGTVTVDDGQILVLGGLIEDNYTTTQSKVPLLGDIPFLGALFRSESRERKRTNLMVFLRPIVMRDADAQQRFSLDRYEQIRSYQMGNQPVPSLVLPIDKAPVLPPPEAGRPSPIAPYEPPASAPRSASEQIAP